VAVVRKVEISHFRGIASLDWCPTDGVNCLVGPGDSCKTTILDAIDLCLGARRNLTLSDADFHGLDVKTPICVSVTIGRLGDSLKNLEAYGMYLRGFDAKSGVIHDEPDTGLETVLTHRLSVEADHEPSWALYSDRAAQHEQSRGLAWADRSAIAPTRLGAYADHNLGWGRASILNKVSDETVAATAALAELGRSARDAFGQQAEAGLPKALEVVHTTARKLGVPVGDVVKAMLDAQSVSFSGGTIALHDATGIPLKGLGLGSKRLLVAGLQRAAASSSPIVLVDEIEHGLEPHRIIRLLGELGAKEPQPPLQVFMTTHSPVAIRELGATQLHLVRANAAVHFVRSAASAGDVQGTIRAFPEALLARSVIVCEGATEHGLLRGLDHYCVANGKVSFTAKNAAIIDGGGENVFRRARAFQFLGYRTAVLHDNDKIPTPDIKAEFETAGGPTYAWRPGCALEEELFLALPEPAVQKMLEYAVSRRGEKAIDDQIRSASGAKHSLATCQANLTTEARTLLGKVSKAKTSGWYKTLSDMEAVARDIVGPGAKGADASLISPINGLLGWISDGAK